MVVVPETGGSGGIWPVASNSRCLKRERLQAFCNSLAKIDAEGSELLLLAQPREWERVRVLIFEFSAARCRKHSCFMTYSLSHGFWVSGLWFRVGILRLY